MQAYENDDSKNGDCFFNDNRLIFRRKYRFVRGGGGFTNAGTRVVDNCTVTENQAANSDGGFQNNGPLNNRQPDRLRRHDGQCGRHF